MSFQGGGGRDGGGANFNKSIKAQSSFLSLIPQAPPPFFYKQKKCKATCVGFFYPSSPCSNVSIIKTGRQRGKTQLTQHSIERWSTAQQRGLIRLNCSSIQREKGNVSSFCLSVYYLPLCLLFDGERRAAVCMYKYILSPNLPKKHVSISVGSRFIQEECTCTNKQTNFVIYR